MSLNGTLNKKEKELVAVGASVAAGCQPCTVHHFEVARGAGASEEEIRQAVDDALCVRHSATRIMAGLADQHLGREPRAAEAPCSDKTLIRELVSVAAALAVNCVTNLEFHLANALQLGATDRQIKSALGVARAIKRVAANKAATAAGAVELAGAVEAKSDDGCEDDCGCQEAGGEATRVAQPGSVVAGKAEADCDCSAVEGAPETASVAPASADEGCACS